jgi:hypothetical protein
MIRAKRRKKRGITIKVPIDEVQDSVADKVVAQMKSDPEFAYTISGLVVALYGYNAEDLDAPFKNWPEGAPSDYTRVRLALEKLKKENAVDAKKHGRGFVYWLKK